MQNPDHMSAWARPISGRLAGLSLAVLVFGAGCASRESQPGPDRPSAELVWPAPPSPPRIAFVQSITRPDDVGVKISTGKRVLRWFTGTDKEADRLIKPFGMALDEQDNLCFTDTGANAVSYFDRTRKVWKRWDRVGDVRFLTPVSVAKRGTTFYVADPGLKQVVLFAEDAKKARSITNHLEHPAGLAISGERLYVVDSRRHAVVVFNLQGEFVSEYGERGAGPGQFNFPTHVAADLDGHILVTDSLNSRVQVFDGQGAFKSQLGSAGDAVGHFGRPKGIAVDSFGHIYVVDGLYDNVQVFDRDGRLLLHFGGSGAKPGEFWLANGVAIGRTNQIYVADAYNRRVQVFQYVGGQP